MMTTSHVYDYIISIYFISFTNLIFIVELIVASPQLTPPLE
jgi:hypothetical protein